MTLHAPTLGSNDLLSALPPAERAVLRPQLTSMRLTRNQELHAAGERIEEVFFVEQGLVSIVAEADGGNPAAEVNLIGRESMVGLAVLLNPRAVSYNRAMVQLQGSAHRLPAQVLHEHGKVLPVLWRRLSLALEVSMAQVAQTAACNGQHQVQQRLARWLLLAHDRVDGDELAFKQDALSIILACRRSGVTVGLGLLEEAGAIGRARARVIVQNRAALEAAACGCYGRVQAFAKIAAAGGPVQVRRPDRSLRQELLSADE